MRFRRVAVRIIGLAIIAAAAACSDTGPTTGPAPTPLIRPQQPPDVASLTRALPGFGGLFIDHGVPTVYLTDLGQRGLAEQLLGGFARARGATGIRVLAGRFAYGDLDKWFQQVSNEAFAQGGVVFVDLDEAANRVLVGVERGSSHANMRSLAARLGVPVAALTVRDADPIHYAAGLQDQVRPVVAGLQINFPGFLCSLGFNAVSGGQNSFVTASHCTTTQGGVDAILAVAVQSAEQLHWDRSRRSAIRPRQGQEQRVPQGATLSLQRLRAGRLRGRRAVHPGRHRADQRPEQRLAGHYRHVHDRGRGW